MAKYLNAEMVCQSFSRLKSRKQTGKVHLERTSVLMYFLAFDSACKFFNTEILNLDPESLDGKNARKQIEAEYAKLILLERDGSAFKLVTELGKIDSNGTIPEKRISSNFFTVPLKKASEQKEPYHYPKRPDAPLLKMGLASTGKQWGISYHEDWESSLPKFFSDIKESTPFLDLAIFVFRDFGFENTQNGIICVIKGLLEQRFTKKLADFWSSKIDKEKLFTRHMIDAPFVADHSLFTKSYPVNLSATKTYAQMNKKDLIERIVYLEGIFDEQGIEY